MGVISSRLRLDKRSDIERRIPFIIRFLSRDYTVRFAGIRKLDPWSLYSTETILESDKLGVVLKAVLYEGYSAPIIVILGSMGKLYVFDGHHRSRVALWLNQPVEAFLLEAPSYKPRISMPLYATPIVNPPVTINDPVLSVWKHMVNIIGFLESRHHVIARIWRRRIPLRELIASQVLVKPVTRPYSPEEPPVLVYNYGDRYYVIDGHTRVCSALFSGLESIEAVVFTLGRKIGIIDTSRYIGEPRFSQTYCRQE